MEERELTQLLQQLGDRVTPGPAPVRRIVDAGKALRARRSGRVRVFAVAAAAAAVVGGGSIAATVLDLSSMTMSTQDSAGGSADGAGGGDNAAEEAAPDADSGGGAGGGDEGAAAADSAGLVVTPAVVDPGEMIELTPGDSDVDGFGLPWRLELRSADGWTWEYWLVARMGASDPTWAPVDEDVLLPQPLIPAPITLVIPPSAAPGDYRVCQVVGSEDLCGFVTVAG